MVRAKKSENLSKSPKKVTFGCAVSNFFKKYFQFSGTATRAEYWWMFVFWILYIGALALVIFSVSLFCSVMKYTVNISLMSQGLLWILAITFVVMAMPWYSLMSRRLHDAGFSAKLLWICVVLMILRLILPWTRGIAWIDWVAWGYSMFLYVLFLFPSKWQNNRYRD